MQSALHSQADTAAPLARAEAARAFRQEDVEAGRRGERIICAIVKATEAGRQGKRIICAIAEANGSRIERGASPSTRRPRLTTLDPRPPRYPLVFGNYGDASASRLPMTSTVMQRTEGCAAVWLPVEAPQRNLTSSKLDPRTACSELCRRIRTAAR